MITYLYMLSAAFVSDAEEKHAPTMVLIPRWVGISSAYVLSPSIINVHLQLQRLCISISIITYMIL